MIVADEILGRVDDARFSGRRVELLSVDWMSALKRRQRRETDAGTDVAVAVDGGPYLFDGAVLADDGQRIVAVRRLAEPALVVRLRDDDPERRLRAAVLVAHAFGNQHVPLEVDGREIRIPLTTSREVAERTVEALGLDNVELACEEVALGRERPLQGLRHHEHHH